MLILLPTIFFTFSYTTYVSVCHKVCVSLTGKMRVKHALKIYWLVIDFRVTQVWPKQWRLRFVVKVHLIRYKVFFVTLLLIKWWIEISNFQLILRSHTEYVSKCIDLLRLGCRVTSQPIGKLADWWQCLLTILYHHFVDHQQCFWIEDFFFNETDFLSDAIYYKK